MARIFYYGGMAGRVGTLRAVVPVIHLSDALSKTKSKFIGKSSPKMQRDDTGCTVIEVLPDEEHGRWKAGFYLIAQEPVEFEDQLPEPHKLQS